MRSFIPVYMALFLTGLALLCTSTRVAAQGEQPHTTGLGTIWVDPGGSGFGDGSSSNPFPTVAQGIAASDAVGGGTLLLQPGSYYETLVIDKQLTMRSASNGLAVIGERAPAELYTRVRSTQIIPSDVFCGSRPKTVINGSCTSKATDANGERPAREHVEIRGWVTGCCDDFRDPECPREGCPSQEFIIGVLLDYGWEPSAPAAANVHPINTVEEINSVITPFNAILFGLPPQGAMTTQLDDEGHIWGGNRATVIHVEVNGWYSGAGGRMEGQSVPSDWIPIETPTVQGVFWSFDPQNPAGIPTRPLRNGDYVRLVGTLWEDAPHLDAGSVGQQDAASCWNSGSLDQGRWGRGWFEIHPVDYMARLPQPPPRTDTLELISVCDPATVIRSIYPPGPRPSPQSTIGCEEYRDEDFIVNQSVRIDMNIPQGDHCMVFLSVDDGGLFGYGAKFKAMYRAFWQ